MKILPILLLLLLLPAHGLGASASSNPNPGLYFKQISIKEGLPSSVTSIYDDSNGFLWVGTDYGLYRFDGERLKRYPIPSLDNSMQQSIHEVNGDGKQNICVLSPQGCCLYNPKNDKFEPLSHQGTTVKAYSFTMQGDSMVLAAKGKLLYLNRKGSIVKTLTLESGEILLRLSSYDSHYYMALTGKSLLKLVHKQSGKIKEPPFGNGEKVYTFFKDSQSRYWISQYGKGIFCFGKDGRTLSSYSTRNSDLSNDVILDIKERNGALWLATDGGGLNILDLQEGSIRVFSNKYSQNFPSNSVSCLCNGVNNMWIGLVRDGLLGVKENFITSYTRTPQGNPFGLSEKCPLCLLEDKDGLIWIGTDGGGLNSFNPADGKFRHYPETLNEKIISLCPYSEQELLVSIYQKGFYVFDMRTGRYKNKISLDTLAAERLIYSGIPNNLYREASGIIRIYNRYIYQLNIPANRLEEIKNAANNIPDNNSWIHIGQYDGKSCFRNNRLITTYDIKSEQAGILYENESPILAACLDSAGFLWMSSYNGLEVLDLGTRQTRNVKLPDKTEIVTSLIMDRNGILWMGTFGSVYAYSKKENAFTVYSETDGVIPNDFLPKPVLVTRNNEVYLGGSAGLVRIMANAFHVQHKETQEAEISLLEIALNGMKANPDRHNGKWQIEVPHGFASITVQTLVKEADIFRKRIYRYYIDGLNDSYTQSSKSVLALQTLPSGSYNVKAQYLQPDGKWSKIYQIVSIKVLSPWWLSYWFILLVTAVSLGLTAYALHYRDERVKQKLKDRERAVYKEKVQMLININNELRTPITLIYSPLKQLLKSSQLPISLKGKVQRIFKQSLQMRNLINMILNMRKMEVGHNILNLSPVPLNSWINSLIEDFSIELEERNITLSLNLDERIGEVAFDPAQCEIVINNLLINAYKFSDPYSGITLSTTIESNNKYVRISITDEGIGLNEEDMQHLFDRFYQSDSSKGGSGIGLSYAKQIVKMHEGDIGAYNNDDKGATFYFTLPYDKETFAVECPVKPYLNETLTKNESRNNSIPIDDSVYDSLLIVEDNPDLCDYLSDNLKSIFRTVYTAHDGMDAFPVIVSRLPQLIISDVTMPRMNGLELCSKIKQNESLNYIPIILLTSEAGEDELKKHFKIGADAYIAKPFDLELLKAQIQNLLYNHNIIKKHYSGTDITTSEKPGNGKDSNAKAEFLIKLNKVVNDNMNVPNLGVDKVASLMGMSRAKLYNKLKETLPMGVNEYITKKRIDSACSLLANTEMTIAEIAEKVGFNHPRNFSTTFKRIMGMIPSEYRKEKSFKDL